MSSQILLFLIKKSVFYIFIGIFQFFITQKVTIFHKEQCEKWTKKNQKSVEISKIKKYKLCKMPQGAKKRR